MLKNLVRLLVGLIGATLLSSWLVQPSLAASSFVVPNETLKLLGNVRADSIIDPESLETSTADDSKDSGKKDPDTMTFDENGNEISTSRQNSRTRILDEAVSSLKQDPPVYVDPRAQLKLTSEEQDELALHIQATGDPMFVAVLPSQAGRPTVVTETIAKEVGKPGVYVTIVGVVYSAYATDFEAKHLLTQAFLDERHYGQAAVLNKFVDLASEQLHGDIPQPQPFPAYFIVLVGCMALALPVILLLSGRFNRNRK